MVISKAGLELHKFLEERGPRQKAVRDKWTRMTLWKWRTGARTPWADTAADLEKMTGGRVKANQWGGGAKRKRVSKRDQDVRTGAHRRNREQPFSSNGGR